MVLQQHVCGCVGCACAALLVCVLYTHQQSSTGTTYTATHMLLQYHILSIEALATSK